jgi:hypothetical protein
LFKLAFSPKRRDVQKLHRAVDKEHGPLLGDHSYRLFSERQHWEIVAEKEAGVVQMLAALKEADVLAPGAFVVRGRVEDRDGRPVPDAHIDLMGGYVYINYFRTRADGTFTMPINAPPENVYHLRIRYGEGKRMRTPSFRLSASAPERVALIRVR